MKFLTWDVGILAALGILIAYSLLIRKHKSLAVLIGTYVAYVMTSIWGDKVVQFLGGNRVVFSQVWIKASASPFLIRSALFVLLIILLSSFMKMGGKRSRYSSVEVVVYAVCAVALAAILIATLMSVVQQQQVFAHSRILPALYAWREWVLGIPIFAMVFFGIYGSDE